MYFGMKSFANRISKARVQNRQRIPIAFSVSSLQHPTMLQL